MVIEHHAVGGGVLLKLTGALRAPVDDQLLMATARKLVRNRCREVIVDLEAVTDIDAAGLGALVAVRNLAKRAGGGLSVLKPSPRVGQLLAVTKLLWVLNVEGAGASQMASADEGAAPETIMPV